MSQTLTLCGGDLAVHKGSAEYDFWTAYQQQEKQLDITTREGFEQALKSFSNPSRIDPHHPHAPASHPLTVKQIAAKQHPTGNINGQIVGLAHKGLAFAGSMIYTEDWKLRQQLFARERGDFAHANADCSQFGASILHWVGNTKVTPTDFTGTLWLKGKQIAKPVAGCGIIWGPYPGVHFGWYVGGGYVIGLGHQGAPDRNTLDGMNIYFPEAGHPGVRFLDFS